MTRLWMYVGILALVGLSATPAQTAPIGNPISSTASDVVTTGGANPFGVVEPSLQAEAEPADVVDEPASLLMFGLGLVGLVFVMKRQVIKR